MDASSTHRIPRATYILALFVASVLGTIWMSTGPMDAIVTAVIIWIIPAAIARNWQRGTWGYYAWPLAVWSAMLFFMIVGKYPQLLL